MRHLLSTHHETSRFCLPVRGQTSLPTQFIGADVSPQDRRCELIAYRSLRELRQALDQLDHPHDAPRLTVVLIVDDRFCGHLPSLIEREHPALRLALASSTGRMPGVSTVGDLSAASAALGWRQITFSRDPQQAIDDAVRTLEEGERVVVFVPSWPLPASA